MAGCRHVAVCLCGLLLGGLVLAGRLVQRRWDDGDTDGTDGTDDSAESAEPSGLSVFTWRETETPDGSLGRVAQAQKRELRSPRSERL